MTETLLVEQPALVMLPLSAITQRLPVRRLNAAGVQRLQQSMQRSGFLEQFPLVVVPLGNGTYQLLDGNHCYEAASALGLASVPCLVKAPLSELECYTLAWQSNHAAETIVPSTLVTYAEFVWERIKDGYTQTEIATMLGWSREKVKNYAALHQIEKEAWDLIGTTFEQNVPIG